MVSIGEAAAMEYRVKNMTTRTKALKGADGRMVMIPKNANEVYDLVEISQERQAHFALSGLLISDDLDEPTAAPKKGKGKAPTPAPTPEKEIPAPAASPAKEAPPTAPNDGPAPWQRGLEAPK